MFNIDAGGGFARLERRLSDMPRQIPYALSLALTDVAQQVRKAEYDEALRVFDRPTKWTLNSLRVKPASKSDLTAAVYFREFAAKGTPANKYLGPQVWGGERSLKRAEIALASKGNRGFPRGTYLVPGKKMKLDKHGNVPRGTIVRILSDLQASSDTGQNRNAAKKSGKYFVGTPGGAPLGVYMRKRDRVEPMLIAVKTPKYSIRLHFGLVAETVTARELMPAFERAARRVRLTAR